MPHRTRIDAAPRLDKYSAVAAAEIPPWSSYFPLMRSLRSSWIMR